MTQFTADAAVDLDLRSRKIAAMALAYWLLWKMEEPNLSDMLQVGAALKFYPELFKAAKEEFPDPHELPPLEFLNLIQSLLCPSLKPVKHSVP